MKRIFIAATKQNDGKTTVSLGLFSELKKKYNRIGFIKPIGQRYLEEEGVKADEDSILIEHVFGIKYGLADMSPIAVEKGFTERYILDPKKDVISDKIKEAFKHVSLNSDLVIIEGTGHAGVGSVFDHSNATVAKMLNSKVILISSGGIGRPIDEIVLNKALFDKLGVKLLGVIVNKVIAEKFKKVDSIIRKGLSRFGIDVLGIMPYMPLLSAPTMTQILDETNFTLLYGKDNLANSVKKIIVGAMEPHNALGFIEDKSLIITPGDRDDMLLAVLNCHLSNISKPTKISGIILTGNLLPHPKIIDLLKNSNIPVLFSKEDTYNVTSQVHDLTVKVRPQDSEKIDLIIEIFKHNVDIDRILQEI